MHDRGVLIFQMQGVEAFRVFADGEIKHIEGISVRTALSALAAFWNVALDRAAKSGDVPPLSPIN